VFFGSHTPCKPQLKSEFKWHDSHRFKLFKSKLPIDSVTVQLRAKIVAVQPFLRMIDIATPDMLQRSLPNV
jgi:hypothetical protein